MSRLRMILALVSLIIIGEQGNAKDYLTDERGNPIYSESIADSPAEEEE